MFVRVELKMNKFPHNQTQSRDFALDPDCSTYRKNPMDISPTSRRFSRTCSALVECRDYWRGHPSPLLFFPIAGVSPSCEPCWCLLSSMSSIFMFLNPNHQHRVESVEGILAFDLVGHNPLHHQCKLWISRPPGGVVLNPMNHCLYVCENWSISDTGSFVGSIQNSQ